MLELADCLSICLNLSTCKSINYETGLCVAFNTSALEHPGISYKISLIICSITSPPVAESLSVSEFPVFTMYAEKICLPTISSRHCNQAWAFEIVGFVFCAELRIRFCYFAELEGFEEKIVTVGDVAECRTKCRDEQIFTCR